MRSTLTRVLSPYLGKDVHPISWMREGSSGEMICPEERDTDENLLHSLRGIQVTRNEPSSLEGGLSQRRGVIDLSHKPMGPNDKTDIGVCRGCGRRISTTSSRLVTKRAKMTCSISLRKGPRMRMKRFSFLSSALGGGHIHKLPQFKPGSDVLFGEASI